MESELLKYALQLPVVGIVVGLVVYFVKVMAHERDKSAAREQKRDETFANAMKESSDTFSKALDRNSQIIGELDRTITQLTFREGGNNHNGARR